MAETSEYASAKEKGCKWVHGVREKKLEIVKPLWIRYLHKAYIHWVSIFDIGTYT